MTIGFLGVGNMGTAMLNGIANSPLCADKTISAIFAFDTNAERLAALAYKSVSICETAQQLVDASDYLILAVKPQVLADVLDALTIRPDQVLISIGAGIGADFIRSHTVPDAKIILVMPNTPLMLGQGASALAKCDGVSDDAFAFALALFRTCGIAEEIPESKMKEIIAINGSSPAFLYLFAKGFLDYAASEGIDADVALRLFAQSMIGSAKMLTDSGHTVDELIKMVSSPGGTTLAGLDTLYQGDLNGITMQCCDACTHRAYTLAGEEKKS